MFDISLPIIARLKIFLQRSAVKATLKILGLALLTVGTIWSIATLGLSWHDISLKYLALNVFILAPINVIIAAAALRINAFALSCNIPSRRSLDIVVAANVAELLPLPGGAVVRGAALVNAGANLADSTRIIILTSILTLLMTLTLSLTTLAQLADQNWTWFAGLSLAGTLGTIVMLLRHVNARDIAAMVGIRVLMLTFTLIRISIAFATLGVSINWLEAATFVIAPTLGAAVAIIPAGLGVTEIIAAGLATIIVVSSASAFLAVALDRALGLLVGAALISATGLLGRKTGAGTT